MIRRTTSLQIRDIPYTIPTPCHIPPPSTFDLSSALISTIDFATCTGITFFISSGTTFAIHAHTPSAPLAQDTFHRLHPPAQTAAVWVHVPLARADTIVALGLQHAQRPSPSIYSYLVSFEYKPTFSSSLDAIVYG